MSASRSSTPSPSGTHGPAGQPSQAAEHAASPRQWSSLRQPAMIALGAGVAALALHLRDPNVAGSWGPTGIGLCPFHAVTGLWCPGCGGLRAVHHLTNLEFSAALSSNMLTVILVGILTVAWVRWVQLRWRGRDAMRMLVLPPMASRAVVATLVVFTVLRNLPVGTILAP